MPNLNLLLPKFPLKFIIKMTYLSFKVLIHHSMPQSLLLYYCFFLDSIYLFSHHLSTTTCNSTPNIPNSTLLISLPAKKFDLGAHFFTHKT